MRVLIVGAGFSGAVVARALAEAGHQVLVVDERDHIAGNCHTERDPATGIMIHRYGPHIFHTDSDRVWDYITRFGEMMPYRHQVRAVAGGEVYTLPINLHTINQFFGQTFSPAEARAHLASLGTDGSETPETFEEQGLHLLGRDLYEAFFAGYTRKQWGEEPARLPASILKRLPVRFSYDDNYFFHRHQGMPKAGYTSIVEKILAVDGVELRLGMPSEEVEGSFDHVVYSGPIDRYFGFADGRLSYRSLVFEEERHEGDFQGTTVLNYCDADVPFTRITEHKHFAPWEAEKFDQTVIFREFSKEGGPDDVPFYPVRLVDDKARLQAYADRAKAETGVTFVGRLGTYAYLDMDVAILRALETADAIIDAWRSGQTAPVFVHDPI